MTTAVIPPPKPVATPANGVPSSAPLPTERRSEEQRFVVDGISYASYVQISDALPERGIRVTYDSGRLELMTTSREHELYDRSLSHLLDLLTEELDMDMAYGGRMTFREETVQKGIEMDNCFWVQHGTRMRLKKTYDPALDPPPDLALEIEVSRSLLNRPGILAAMKVPEVWRYDGTTIFVLLLNASGQYEANTRSKAFPFLPVQELVRFLHLPGTMSHAQVARAFRAWVQQ